MRININPNTLIVCRGLDRLEEAILGLIRAAPMRIRAANKKKALGEILKSIFH